MSGYNTDKFTRIARFSRLDELTTRHS